MNSLDCAGNLDLEIDAIVVLAERSQEIARLNEKGALATNLGLVAAPGDQKSVCALLERHCE